MTILTERVIKSLEQFNLTHNDAIIYLCLTKKGIVGPSDIETETKIKRARIYDSLKRLTEKGLVVQELGKKRSQYRITNPDSLLSELENQITNKKDAFKDLQEYFSYQPPSLRLSGIYFYNADRPLRLELKDLIKTSQKKITLMVIFSNAVNDDDLLSYDILAQKSLEGQEITLILNVNAGNWEFCADLFAKGVAIYHYPLVNQLSTLVYLIDDNVLCISTFEHHETRLRLQSGILFSEHHDLITVYQFLIQNFINQSVPLKTRLEELKKSIIYPSDRLKSLFGIKE